MAVIGTSECTGGDGRISWGTRIIGQIGTKPELATDEGWLGILTGDSSLRIIAPGHIFKN
jgi:hypothetical protein